MNKQFEVSFQEIVRYSVTVAAPDQRTAIDTARQIFEQGGYVPEQSASVGDFYARDIGKKLDVSATNAAISANLHSLGKILDDAQNAVVTGIMALDIEDNRNGAIGAVFDLDRTLESALALLRAALALHRYRKA